MVAGVIVPTHLQPLTWNGKSDHYHTLVALPLGKIRYPLYGRWTDCNSVLLVLVMSHMSARTRKMHHYMDGQLNEHWELLFGKQHSQKPFIIEHLFNIWWLLVFPHPTTLGLFQLFMNLIYLDNLLKCYSLSAFCACKLPEYSDKIYSNLLKVYTICKLLQYVSCNMLE